MARIKIKRWARPRLTREGILCVFGPGSEGLACRVDACPNPACACRDVIIHTIPIDIRVRSVELRAGSLKFYSDAIEGAGPAADTEAAVRVRVVVETGDLILEDGSLADFEAMPRLSWLSEALDGKLLDDLAGFVATVKGVSLSENTPQLGRIILQDWTPGEKVFYGDVFSPARQDMYRVGDEIYPAIDMYCVKPGCMCNEVTVAFGTMGEDPSHEPGAAHIGLTSGKVIFDHDCRDPELTARLWALFIKRHRGLDYLAARQQKMSGIGPQLEAMWKAEPGGGGPLPRPERAAGRNDPCPCGSGRKYKKCCLIKKQ